MSQTTQKYVIRFTNGIKNSQIEEFDFSKPELSIGRDTNNDIQFDPETELGVSREHGKIIKKADDCFILVDNNSRNGTFVNGKKVTGKVLIQPGDEIKLGVNGPTFIFDLDPKPYRPPMPTQLMEVAPKTSTIEADVNQASVALPGINTTAHLLFGFAYPKAEQKVFKVFHEIEDAVLHGDNELGVIIHENRFTYQVRGLHKVLDLGAHWEQKMKVPIPLGGIVIKKKLGVELFDKVNELIRQSLQYSFDHYPEISNFVKQNAQEMSEEVMRQHIGLYVNEYTLDLGEEGRTAVAVLKEIFEKLRG